MAVGGPTLARVTVSRSGKALCRSISSDLELAFTRWKPLPPEVEARSRCDVTLSWEHCNLVFLRGELLYRVERKERIPSWVVVYSGGKSTKIIDNLAPCSPHKFRLRVIVKATAVPHLAERAIEYYGSEEAAYEALSEGLLKDVEQVKSEVVEDNTGGIDDKAVSETRDTIANNEGIEDKTQHQRRTRKNKCLQSEWSNFLCTSTESEGTSATCFCMAVQGGYLKQVQILLEERPALIDIVNTTNGYTPLGTAVRKGDMNMVRYLVSAGAGLQQRSCGGRTALHLATLDGNLPLVDLLLERGADFQTRDINDLRVEHYAVDSGDVDTVRHIMARGGDVTVRDSNGWTPLFRAVCQGAATDMIEELVKRGSDINVTDAAGLSLAAAARLLTNRHGRARDSILRLVDSQYPHEKAVANFTRLTKKISSVHSLLKL